MNKIEYEHLLAVHPGYYIKDAIEASGISQEELAMRLETTPKYVSDLLNGNILLTDEMILKLSIVFNTSTTMWLNLNNAFIETKLEIEKQKQLDLQKACLKYLNYHYWENLDVVKKTNDIDTQIQELQRYFRIFSLDVLKNKQFLIQYGKNNPNLSEKQIVNTNAWIQTAINMTQFKEVDYFEKKRLKKEIFKIKKMMHHFSIEKLEKILATCGIYLVVLPQLDNCMVEATVKWIGKETVLLALEENIINQEDFDILLFYLLGIILEKRLKVLYVYQRQNIDFRQKEMIEKMEVHATDFSRDALLSKKEYQQFINIKKYTKEIIEAYARKQNIKPSVLLHFLKQDQIITETEYNNLKGTMN